MKTPSTEIARIRAVLKTRRLGKVVLRTENNEPLLTVLHDGGEVLVTLSSLQPKIILKLLKNFRLALHTPPEISSRTINLLFEDHYSDPQHAATVAESIRLAFASRRVRSTSSKKRTATKKKEANDEQLN